MSGVIKAGDAAAARAWPFAPPGPGAKTATSAVTTMHEPDPRIAALEIELAETIRRAEKFVTENEALRAARERAYADGERAGRAEGRREAEGTERERLAAFENAVATALAQHNERSAAALDLGRVIAFEALSRLLDDDHQRADLLSRIVATQFARLERASILRIEVSRADFADAEAIGHLRARAGEQVQIELLEQAPRGHCRIIQALGTVDAGIDGQLARLATLLLPEARHNAG